MCYLNVYVLVRQYCSLHCSKNIIKRHRYNVILPFTKYPVDEVRTNPRDPKYVLFE